MKVKMCAEGCILQTEMPSTHNIRLLRKYSSLLNNGILHFLAMTRASELREAISVIETENGSVIASAAKQSLFRSGISVRMYAEDAPYKPKCHLHPT